MMLLAYPTGAAACGNRCTFAARLELTVISRRAERQAEHAGAAYAEDIATAGRRWHRRSLALGLTIRTWRRPLLQVEVRYAKRACCIVVIQECCC
jgi:hypothetical protein